MLPELEKIIIEIECNKIIDNAKSIILQIPELKTKIAEIAEKLSKF